MKVGFAKTITVYNAKSIKQCCICRLLNKTLRGKRNPTLTITVGHKKANQPVSLWAEVWFALQPNNVLTNGDTQKQKYLPRQHLFSQELKAFLGRQNSEAQTISKRNTCDIALSASSDFFSKTFMIYQKNYWLVGILTQCFTWNKTSAKFLSVCTGTSAIWSLPQAGLQNLAPVTRGDRLCYAKRETQKIKVNNLCIILPILPRASLFHVKHHKINYHIKNLNFL